MHTTEKPDRNKCLLAVLNVITDIYINPVSIQVHRRNWQVRTLWRQGGSQELYSRAGTSFASLSGAKFTVQSKCAAHPVTMQPFHKISSICFNVALKDTLWKVSGAPTLNKSLICWPSNRETITLLDSSDFLMQLASKQVGFNGMSKSFKKLNSLKIK